MDRKAPTNATVIACFQLLVKWYENERENGGGNKEKEESRLINLRSKQEVCFVFSVCLLIRNITTLSSSKMP